jgi:hypothetical protein
MATQTETAPASQPHAVREKFVKTKGIMRNSMRAGLLALALGAGLVPAAAASAGTGPAAGTWRVHDNGQGCWGGGAMYADGSLGGSGGCSILVQGAGHEIARIDPQTWTPQPDGMYLICVNITIKSGPPFVPAGLACIPLPVTSGAPANIPQLGPDTYGNVVLTG